MEDLYSSHRAWRRLLLGGSAAAALAVSAQPAWAQDDDDQGSQDVVVVTGTRIQTPNVTSSSPIQTVAEAELEFQLEPNVERIFRNLPGTIPGDGQNVNNGTAGATTIDLRGLGPQRSLVLVNGKRLTPFAGTATGVSAGVVDVQTVPVNMLERIDIVTGGASAVYGSDAMSGAVNFVLKEDFEGFELEYNGSISEQSDGETQAITALMGTNFADGRGNVMFSLGYTDRVGVQFGDREFGRVGVSTTNGSGLDGQLVLPEEDNCQNPENADETASGSTTAIPAALDLPGQTLQFRNDGTLGPRCSVFNFNPFNYYQTPQERFNLDAVGYYEVNNHLEIYGRGNFTATNVEQQVAPSGVFGNVFTVPLANPFLGAQAQQAIIDQVNTFAGDAGVDVFDPTTGAIDNNNNGIFDLADSISVPIRRRTLELGTRSEAFDANQLHFVIGARGDLFGDWTYDLSYQHGESDRTRVRAGYTNVSNIAIALNTVDATQCITPEGTVGPSTCVPLDIFSGGFGSITSDMVNFSSVTALIQEKTTQDIVHASATGPLGIASPFAQNEVAAAVGAEYRQERASTLPDDCLQTPPTSCQGGAGGNLLPVEGEYDVYEAFGELYLPLIEGAPLVEDLNVELGFRLSDYSITGQDETWKAGVNWSPIDSLRFRAMFQVANRAPNISELFRPVTTGLSNATLDPCSAGNPNPIDAELRALCESTGVPPALVGVVGDIVAGQVNQFAGTDPNALPDPESAETLTLGAVWTPNIGGFFNNPVVSVDYYDIEITDFIGTFSGQEAMDACYVLADPEACAGIVRINGSLATSGAGLPGFTTNLSFVRAEGVEVSATTGIELGELGELEVAFNGNYYLSNDLQSASFSDVVDCNGFYGTTCDPVPQLRFVQRTTWDLGDLEFSYLWRYIDSMDVQTEEAANVFPAFRSIDAYHYLDLSAAYEMNDNVRFVGTVDNLFDEEPPIIGNSTGTTSFNSGNTFPSLYDVLGRTYSLGVKVRF